jgi:hypothetical protein
MLVIRSIFAIKMQIGKTILGRRLPGCPNEIVRAARINL